MECPSCGRKVIIFRIDDAINEYIHLFEVIAIFSAIVLLLPQLTIGLKDLGLLTISEKQIVPLYFSLVFCCILIVFFWIAIITRISLMRNQSPVRIFLPSPETNWISWRRGDAHFFFFVFVFFLLYIAISLYIFSTLNIGFVLLGIALAGFALIDRIFDYFSADKSEIDLEIDE